MLKRTRSFLVLVMLLMTVTMSAQVTTATMSGKVTAQDEPIIGATIVAIHEPSGTRYGTVTNVSGLVGELVTVGGKSKIAVRLNMLGCACVDMPIGYVEPTKISNDDTKKL